MFNRFFNSVSNCGWNSGAFALFFGPHRRAFDILSALAPGNLPSIRKKRQMGTGIELELSDSLPYLALERISKRLKSNVSKFYPISNPKVIFWNVHSLHQIFLSIQRSPESFPKGTVAGITTSTTSQKRSRDFKIRKLSIWKPYKNKNTHQLLLITSKPRDII